MATKMVATWRVDEANLIPIDGFHSDVINCEVKIARFYDIYIRLKINKK